MEMIAFRKNNLQFLKSPNYSLIFSFENDFNSNSHVIWMRRNWIWSLYLSFAYIAVIFGLKKFMSSRAAFNTTPFLVMWNIVLAIFSILGTTRCLPEFFYGIREFGIHHSICDTSYLTENRITAFWSFAFTASKVIELGDTLFIVFRKQNLTFLHTAHHAITLVISWFVYQEQVGISRWPVNMNYFVHSVMYTYFALRAQKVKIPRAISMAITTFQLLQMFLGCFVSVYGLTMFLTGGQCHVTRNAALCASAMYSLYIYLFGKFFFDNYIANNKEERSMKKKSN